MVLRGSSSGMCQFRSWRFSVVLEGECTGGALAAVLVNGGVVLGWRTGKVFIGLVGNCLGFAGGDGTACVLV